MIIDARVLLHAVRTAGLFAAAPDTTLSPVLTGMHVRCRNAEATFEATDRYSAARIQVEATGDEEFTWPAPGLMLSAAKTWRGPLEVGPDGVRRLDGELLWPLAPVEGRWPRLHRLWDDWVCSEPVHTLTVRPDRLTALSRVKAPPGARRREVDLEFRFGSTLRVTSGDWLDVLVQPVRPRS